MTFAPNRSSRYLAFVAAICLAAGGAVAATIGEMAPSFALPTAEATTIDLERLRGQVVYVDFWASWRFGDRGLTIVAINVDAKRGDAERFLRQFPATFAVVYDGGGATPRAYGVKAMPSSFIVDARGRIVAIESGFHEDRRVAIEETIRSLITRP
jgi:cytochrome c biogenesis protein CcmG/thiol:disulfide interchange protein DsbE